MNTQILTIIFTILLFAGCSTGQLRTDPARQHTDLTTGQIGQTTSNNPGKTLTRTQEKYHPDGTLAERMTLSETGAVQYFSMPDFAGENWMMYAGIAVIIAGVAIAFLLGATPFGPFGWPLAGVGLLLCVLGSQLKTGMAPWILIGGIMAVLGVIAYRNRKALIGIVRGVEDTKRDDPDSAKAVTSRIDKTTTEADDKIIRGVK